MTLADRIVVLNAGDIHQVRTPMELYEPPANLFVAQFIGAPTMTVLGVEGQKDAMRLATGTASDCPAHTRHIGIRPEPLELVSPDNADIRAESQVIERLGSDTDRLTEAAGLGQIPARVHGTVDLRPGAEVGLKRARDKMLASTAKAAAVRDADLRA